MARTRIKYCGLSLLNLQEVRDTKWSKGHLLVSLKDGLTGLPGLLADAFRAEVQSALDGWAAVCGLTFEMVEEDRRANILIDCGRIDGPGNTLAWSYLPPADPVNQLYDTGEKAWTRDAGGKRVAIDVGAVVSHELGHAIGLQHDPRPGALMSAFYDPAIRRPTERDIARVQALYGAPAPVPPPTPSDPPVSDEPGTMIILGKATGKETYRASLVRVPTEPSPRARARKKP